MQRNDLEQYLLSNEDALRQVVSDLNSWNGSLEHLQYHENDEEFFDNFFSNPHEAVRAVYFGDYHYNDDYVKFNGYGNLESANDYKVLEEMQDSIGEILDALESNYENLELDEELLEFFEEEDEEEEE